MNYYLNLINESCMKYILRNCLRANINIFSRCPLHRQINRIKVVQNSLNSFEAVLKVLPHLSTNNDKMVREVLAFLVSMLYGGNQEVQVLNILSNLEINNFFTIKGILIYLLSSTYGGYDVI